VPCGPGWLLEVIGNNHPRGMVIARATAYKTRLIALLAFHFAARVKGKRTCEKPPGANRAAFLFTNSLFKSRYSTQIVIRKACACPLPGQRQTPHFFCKIDGLIQAGGSPRGVHNRTRKKTAMNGQYHQDDDRQHVYVPPHTYWKQSCNGILITIRYR